MNFHKCDMCNNAITEPKDKYRVKCSGECKRTFCLSCTGLDRQTSKIIQQQKYHQLQYFCALCDSPNLKYLHDKVSNIVKNQVTNKNLEVLGTLLKKVSNAIPANNEIHEILFQNESKWADQINKIDEIYQICTLNDGRLYSITKSIEEIKQDLFTLSSVFFEENKEVKIQIHNPAATEIKKGIEEISKNFKCISTSIANLHRTNLSPTKLSTKKLSAESCSTSTQTEENSPIPTLNKLSTRDSYLKQSMEPALVSTSDNTQHRKWHYVIVDHLPTNYKANHVVHYVKEKLGKTDFVRCFSLLKDDEKNSLSVYKIGMQNSELLKKLFSKDFWAQGVSVRCSIESKSFDFTPPPESSACMKNKILISSVKDAISKCRSMQFNSNTAIQFVKGNSLDSDKPNIKIDPLTPIRVKLTKESFVSNGLTHLARFREARIMDATRLYLAYLHDQPQTVCYEGYTFTSVKCFLASEGLPTDIKPLKELLYNYFEGYNINKSEVDADLLAFKSYLEGQRIIHLQRSRESHRNYYNINKNF